MVTSLPADFHTAANLFHDFLTHRWGALDSVDPLGENETPVLESDLLETGDSNPRRSRTYTLIYNNNESLMPTELTFLADTPNSFSSVSKSSSHC